MRRLKFIVAILAPLALACCLACCSAAPADTYQVRELSFERDGATIYGRLFRPRPTRAGSPLVVISHGFGGALDGTSEYARCLAEAGVASYVFDFRGGSSWSKRDGSILDMSVLTEADDLEAVMDGLLDGGYVAEGNLYLMGESQGGLVSALVAARRPDDVAGLVLFYPALSIPDDARARFSDASAIPGDEVVGLFGVTVGRRYYEDILGLDPFATIGDYKGPVTIYHGDKDEIVPLAYSQRAVETYENAELHVVSGAGHGFSGNQLDEVCAAAADFVRGARR
ncbi:MAG TPA: alpha/beta hydrolase [Candidatus Olsenella pullicola]|nr:alpha/beta hydrolase [Candidatus Olsenella pullicola]